MKTRPLIVGLGYLMLVCGCAGIGGKYIHSSKTGTDIKPDLAECNTDTRKAMGRGDFPGKSLGAYLRQVDLCMFGRGWNKVDSRLGVVDSTWVESMKLQGLMQAVWIGDDNGIKRQLNNGSDVNGAWVSSEGWIGKGYTPIYIAAEKGWTSTVNLLLSNGANPNEQFAPDSSCPGWTPLMITAANRHADTVVALLRAGSGVDMKNSLGRTALMYAALYGDVQIVKALLDHRADANILPADKTGRPALSSAAMNGHLEVVRLLLDKGADASIRDKEGKTALGWAKKRGFTAVSDLLEAKGAVE